MGGTSFFKTRKTAAAVLLTSATFVGACVGSPLQFDPASASPITNNDPVFGSGSFPAQNVVAGVGGVVYTNAATDSDQGDTLTYSVSVTDAQSNSVNGFTVNSSGVVSASASVAAGTYSVVVSVSDGTATVADASVSITVDAAPVVPPTNHAPSFGQGSTPAQNVVAGVGGVVYTNAATDSDQGDTLTYSVSVTDAQSNSVNGFTVNSSGVVSASASVAAGTYSVVVSVSDGHGSPVTATRSITIDAAPAPSTPPTSPAVAVPGSPSAVNAVSGDASATITWTAPTSNGGASVTDYLIEISSDGGQTWSVYADGVSAGTSASITGLKNGQTYSVRVKAVNSVGASASSNTSTFTPKAPIVVPPAPKSYTAVGRLSFASGVTLLTKAGKAVLQQFLSRYEGRSSLKIVVTGVASSASGRAAATLVAKARASQIASFIKSLKLGVSVVTAISIKDKSDSTNRTSTISVSWTE